MKNLLFLLFPAGLLFSQDQCFDDGTKQYRSGTGILQTGETEASAVSLNRGHILFRKNEKVPTYEQDKMSYDEAAGMASSDEHKSQSAVFEQYFNKQFSFIQFQKEGNSIYAVGENSFGYWLLEIKNTTPKAYYIGFSKNTHINSIQNSHFIRNNKLYLDGSFIGTAFGARFPKIKAVMDSLSFEADLADIKRDSDGDGYNDFFENLIFLNPDSRDTDGDGISDFDDRNPLFPSAENPFTGLLKQIIDSEAYSNETENQYTFRVYESECEFLQKVNPEKTRVLIVSGNQSYRLKNDFRATLFRTFYGKIKKDPDGKTFYIPYFKNSGGGKIIATYENGKWSFTEDLEYKV